MPAVRYGQALRRHWPTIGVLSALGAFLLGAVAVRQPPRYEADLRLAASVRAPTAPAEAPAADGRLVESRVRAYTQKATSRPVLAAVGARLGLPDRPQELAGHVRALTPLGTTFIDIAVVDTDPRRAARIGEAIAAELSGLAAGERSATPLRITVDRPPAVPSEPLPRPWPRYALGGLLGGLALGAALALLRTELASRGQTVGGWLGGLPLPRWL